MRCKEPKPPVQPEILETAAMVVLSTESKDEFVQLHQKYLAEHRPKVLANAIWSSRWSGRSGAGHRLAPIRSARAGAAFISTYRDTCRRARKVPARATNEGQTNQGRI